MRPSRAILLALVLLGTSSADAAPTKVKKSAPTTKSLTRKLKNSLKQQKGVESFASSRKYKQESAHNEFHYALRTNKPLSLYEAIGVASVTKVKGGLLGTKKLRSYGITSHEVTKLNTIAEKIPNAKDRAAFTKEISSLAGKQVPKKQTEQLHTELKNLHAKLATYGAKATNFGFTVDGRVALMSKVVEKRTQRLAEHISTKYLSGQKEFNMTLEKGASEVLFRMALNSIDKIADRASSSEKLEFVTGSGRSSSSSSSTGGSMKKSLLSKSASGYSSKSKSSSSWSTQIPLAGRAYQIDMKTTSSPQALGVALEVVKVRSLVRELQARAHKDPQAKSMAEHLSGWVEHSRVELRQGSYTSTTIAASAPVSGILASSLPTQKIRDHFE